MSPVSSADFRYAELQPRGGSAQGSGWLVRPMSRRRAATWYLLENEVAAGTQDSGDL